MSSSEVGRLIPLAVVVVVVVSKVCLDAMEGADVVLKKQQW